MATFFSPGNPFVLVPALIIFYIVVKKLVSKAKIGKKDLSAALVMLITLVLCGIVVLFFSLLKVIAYAIPLFMIAVIAVVLTLMVFAMSGISSDRMYAALNFGTTKFFFKLVGIVILVYAGSMVFGQALLENRPLTAEEGGVGYSILDGIAGTPEPAATGLSFAPLFSMPVLGFAMIVIIMVMALMVAKGVWIFGK